MDDMARRFVQLLAVFGALVTLCTGYYVEQSEINALQDLYTSTRGENWAWLYPLSTYGQKWDFVHEPVDPCDNWQGVLCAFSADGATGTISNVLLNSYNLVGTLPNSLHQLRNASILDMTSNSLTGSLPSTLNNMSWLWKLRLSYNSISGPLPSNLFRTGANLTYLSLTNNLISGTVPSFPNDHSLVFTDMYFNGNALTGTIPEDINEYSNLKIFFVGYNQMEGTIPETIYQLSQATRIALNGNSFTGTISNSIGTLSQLVYMYMQDNYLTGTMPASLGNLSQMTFITLFENIITGSFPATLGHLKNLRSIAADTNYITGTIPPELGDCPSMEEFNLYSNLLTGPLPASLAQLANLQLVLVQSNHLTGPLGQAFNRTLQTQLQNVDLAVNKFSGTIPDAIFGTALQSFSAFQNCLSGDIPASICDSTLLQSIVLDGISSACATRVWPAIPNSPKTLVKVAGTVAECIWSLPDLSVLHLSSNALSGTIPSLASYGNLSDLDISYNLFYAPVPERLQGWPTLQNLNLKSNRFCGDITGTGNLHFSYHDGQPGTKLTLSENRFSGIIPPQILAAVNVDIVVGNMFSCTFKHLPPYNDPNGRTYVCGSNLLYVSMASLAAVLGVVVLVVAAFYYVSYRLVQKYGMGKGGSPGAEGESPSYQAVRARMAEVYSSVAGTSAIFAKLSEDAQESFGYAKGVIVRMIGWQRQIDALIRNEDYRHAQVTQLGGLLKEALLANPDGAVEGSALHLLQHMDVASLKSANVPHLVQFLKSLRILRNTGVVLCIAQLALTIPAFPILKHYYGTYAYQYGWYMSGAFVSGTESALTIILIWFVALAIVLYAIVRYIPSRKALNYRVALQNRAYELLVLWRRLERSHEAGEGPTDTAAIKRLADAPVPAELERVSGYSMTGALVALSRATTLNWEPGAGPGTTQRPPDSSERQSSIQLATFAQQLGSALGSPSISGHMRSGDEADSHRQSRITVGDGSASSTYRSTDQRSQKTWYDYVASYMRHSVAISIVAVLLDVVVVLSIKGLFIYALSSNLTSFAYKVAIELSLSCVDLAWSVMLVPFIITRLPRMKPAGKMILKIALLYFNSILAPVLALAVTEANCFNGMFVRQESVSEPFQFSYCILYESGDPTACYGDATWETTIKYTPPFMYNYNCYSTVITSYSPVFLFSYCILSLCLPAASMYITTLTSRRWLKGVVPAVFWLDEAPKQGGKEGGSAEGQTDVEGDEQKSAQATVTHPLHQRGAAPSNAASTPTKRGLQQSASSASLASELSSPSVDTSTTNIATNKNNTKESKPRRQKKFLFFPGFILASAIHHILVLLTFGLMLPVLGLAIAVVMVITTTTWELVIGRYLSQSPQCDPGKWQLPESTAGGEKARSSSATVESSLSKLTARPAMEDCSGGLDALCVHVACCARKCKVLIAYGSAVIFACFVFDMAADTSRATTAVWAPVTVLVLPMLLILALKWSRIGTTDQTAYEEVCAQQATTETLMLMRGATMSEDPRKSAAARAYGSKESRFAHPTTDEAAADEESTEGGSV